MMLSRLFPCLRIPSSAETRQNLAPQTASSLLSVDRFEVVSPLQNIKSPARVVASPFTQAFYDLLAAEPGQALFQLKALVRDLEAHPKEAKLAFFAFGTAPQTVLDLVNKFETIPGALPAVHEFLSYWSSNDSRSFASAEVHRVILRLLDSAFEEDATTAASPFTAAKLLHVQVTMEYLPTKLIVDRCSAFIDALRTMVSLYRTEQRRSFVACIALTSLLQKMQPTDILAIRSEIETVYNEALELRGRLCIAPLTPLSPEHKCLTSIDADNLVIQCCRLLYAPKSSTSATPAMRKRASQNFV